MAFPLEIKRDYGLKLFFLSTQFREITMFLNIFEVRIIAAALVAQ